MVEFTVHNVDRSSWCVPSCYENLKIIGHGSFGTICSCRDNVTGKDVAIKRLVRPFTVLQRSQRTYQELEYFRYLRHTNIISLLDIFTPQSSRQTFEEVYLVMDQMDADLASFTRGNQLTNDQIRKILHQILCALKYFHNAGIIHADLKPSNIAVNKDLSVKLLDFGTLRKIKEGRTFYQVNRSYMAPELKMSWVNYTNQVDIWSVGCIMTELVMGDLSFAGSDRFNEIEKIILLTGSPNEEFISKMIDINWKEFVINFMHKTERKDFNSYFGKYTDDSDAIDLLDKILVLDPDRRINVLDALDHPYIADHHNEIDYLTLTEFRNRSTGIDNIEILKDEVWSYIQSFQGISS